MRVGRSLVVLMASGIQFNENGYENQYFELIFECMKINVVVLKCKSYEHEGNALLKVMEKINNENEVEPVAS